MEALYDADELDDYIDDHAAEFAAYSPDGEQRLEWTSIHASTSPSSSRSSTRCCSSSARMTEKPVHPGC